MKKITIIAAALALGLPATAYAAADCCKDGKGHRCSDIGQGGNHARQDSKSEHASHVSA